MVQSFLAQILAYGSDDENDEVVAAAEIAAAAPWVSLVDLPHSAVAGERPDAILRGLMLIQFL